jgi:hypothetical protein
VKALFELPLVLVKDQESHCEGCQPYEETRQTMHPNCRRPKDLHVSLRGDLKKAAEAPSEPEQNAMQKVEVERLDERV